MTLKEFANSFCGDKSYQTDNFFVELEEMEYPFQERICLSRLLLLNLKEKCWLDHDVLYIVPGLVFTKNEWNYSYESKIIIHISNVERK